MPRKIDGNNIILLMQLSILVRPEAVIAAGAVDENQDFVCALQNHGY